MTKQEKLTEILKEYADQVKKTHDYCLSKYIHRILDLEVDEETYIIPSEEELNEGRNLLGEGTVLTAKISAVDNLSYFNQGNWARDKEPLKDLAKRRDLIRRIWNDAGYERPYMVQEWIDWQNENQSKWIFVYDYSSQRFIVFSYKKHQVQCEFPYYETKEKAKQMLGQFDGELEKIFIKREI